MNLILITQSYPYIKAAEQTFLNQEINFLSYAFDRILIIPQNRGGARIPMNHSNIDVDEEYSKTKKDVTSKMAVKKIFSYGKSIYDLIMQEIISTPDILFNIRKILMMLISIYKSNEFYLYIDKFIYRRKIDISKAIFYTFWFQTTTNGLAILGKKYPNLIIVTRTHGKDLFKERNAFNYIPFRSLILKRINIFPCMNFGTQYFKKNYSEYKLIETSYLGVDDFGIICNPSRDGVFRIVTCSNIISLKRLDLLAMGIKELSGLNNEYKIEWIHFGDGDLKDEIINLTQQLFKDAVKVIFMGHVSLEEIISYYKRNPVDVFINVSEYEGQPVSIKEAVNVGIPVIATDVGGNSEIVTKQNGILLDSNPSPKEIAEAIKWLLENPFEALEMRKNSRKIFLEKYDSKKVYPEFINKLFKIAETG